jgi:hypothetical protein
MADIFADGLKVDTLQIPEKIKNNGFRKQDWGCEELKAYIHKKHGAVAATGVQRSRSNEGKVTGTQVVFEVSKKRITYMLVEVKGGQGLVNIIRMEESLETADFLTLYREQSKMDDRPLRHSPFAALA